MANSLNIYLFYYKDFPEPDTWDYKFSHYFGMIFSQIYGPDVQLYSNLDVSGSKVLNVKDIDANLFGAFVIIQNTIGLFSGSIDSITGINPSIIDFSKNRIFQVVKKGSAGQIEGSGYSLYPQYKFFELNYRTFKVVEYNPDAQGDSENGFWEKLSDLAYDIKIANLASTATIGREDTIYLAEVSDDQVKNRERVKRELLLLGYKILPSSPLLRNTEDFENSVISYLYESILSVNILGEMYGEAPQMSDYSYVELQNRIFEKEHSAQKKLTIEPKIHRIIWTQPVLEYFDEKQTQYVKRLQRDSLQVHDTELVQSSVSDLIEIIVKKIKQIKSEGFEFIEEEQKSSLYIIIDHLDEEQKQVLQQKLDKDRLLYLYHDTNTTTVSDISHLLSILKLQNNYLIINTQKTNSWVNSMISLIIRSKGLAGAVPLSSLILFTNDTDRNFEYLLPVEISLISYRPYKFDEQIESILSKLKV